MEHLRYYVHNEMGEDFKAYKIERNINNSQYFINLFFFMMQDQVNFFQYLLRKKTVIFGEEENLVTNTLAVLERYLWRNHTEEFVQQFLLGSSV